MTYKIKESVIDCMTTAIVTRKIEKDSHCGLTSVSLEFDDSDNVVGLNFDFNGHSKSTLSQETIEELRRFKALLNSFTEL